MSNDQSQKPQPPEGIPDPTVEEISEIIQITEELKKLKDSYQPPGISRANGSYFLPTKGGVGYGDGAENILDKFASLEDPDGLQSWDKEVQVVIDRLLSVLAPCRAFILKHGPERLQNREKVERWIWSGNPDEMTLLIRELGNLKAIVKKIQAVPEAVEKKAEGGGGQTVNTDGGNAGETETVPSAQIEGQDESHPEDKNVSPHPVIRLADAVYNVYNNAKIWEIMAEHCQMFSKDERIGIPIDRQDRRKASEDLRRAQKELEASIKIAVAAIPGVDPYVRGIAKRSPGEWTTELKSKLMAFWGNIGTEGVNLFCESLLDKWNERLNYFHETQRFLRNIDTSVFDETSSRFETESPPKIELPISEQVGKPTQPAKKTFVEIMQDYYHYFQKAFSRPDSQMRLIRIVSDDVPGKHECYPGAEPDAVDFFKLGGGYCAVSESREIMYLYNSIATSIGTYLIPTLCISPETRDLSGAAIWSMLLYKEFESSRFTIKGYDILTDPLLKSQQYIAQLIVDKNEQLAKEQQELQQQTPMQPATVIEAESSTESPAKIEGQDSEQKARHSPDFHSVHWFGIDYTFTALQSDAVEILYEAWQNRTPEVGEAYILRTIGSDSKHLKDIFKGHPAFGKMIQAGSKKGAFRLVEPSPV